MTVHLVNLINPMMMKGSLREFIPVGEQKLRIKIPPNTKARKIHSLVSDIKPNYEISGNIASLAVSSILDHEVVALDLAT